MQDISRRTCLFALAAAAASPKLACAQTSTSLVENYLRQLVRKDGGYAWDDQPQSHLTPTYSVIGASRLLEIELPHRKGLANYVREHHPAKWKKLEQEHREFELQQIQSLLWLSEDAHEFRELVAKWREPVPYLKQYERDGHPVFRHQVTAVTARQLLGMPMTDLAPSMIEYIDARRRSNGSFNNTPAADDSDGHVLNTLWGLQALSALGRTDERRDETIRWLKACQRDNGGFTWQPQPSMSAVSNVTYTWAAVRALELLGSEPDEPARTAAFVAEHLNNDGGFADRVGWLSNPVATYYALDVLKLLAPHSKLSEIQPAHRSLVGAVRTAAPSKPRQKLSPDLKVFSIQIQAHGGGSPADAVRLAEALQIHMWGAKNSKPGWIERAQAIADLQKVPVTFFPANEEYGSWTRVPGLGTYSHMSDMMAPSAEAAAGSLASAGVVSWPEFRQRRIEPLLKNNGRMVWQFGENEELVRLLLDDSLERQGFAAISTFHFGNPDFTNTEPFLQHYRGQIPFIALQDAHGAEPWWFADMTTGFRTLFLAKTPTWKSWLEALDNHWTVAVRNDEQSHDQLLMHAGSREVSDFVLERKEQWQWWDNSAIRRPMVSLVAIRPDDRWESGAPERGVQLRLRCAWSNTNQGQLKDPMAELVSLVVDGKQVEPTLKTSRGGRNPRLLGDQAYLWPMPDADATGHSAVATVRVIKTGELVRQEIQF